MKEIHRIAHEYVWDEDVNKVVSGKRNNTTSQPNKRGSQGPSTLPTRPPVPRISQRGILSKPLSIRPRPNLNRSLYCDYHKSSGHRTKDCFDLKDALEQVIREGKLFEFVQHVRPPRKQGDEDEREGRNPQSQRQTELATDKAQVMINVMIGTSQLEKSNSVAKKILKSSPQNYCGWRRYLLFNLLLKITNLGHQKMINP
ncbi:hypothetical protein PIB30_095364 [Stylosanthes scabra]|uniref:Reverse transcriptase domain-containing protein n=1 Tax=Stylosanthes scabra TaxID=79078 RepID=A0ABU6RWM4_9FABA|nr:hypothetical protein [Stylosanthes scabra]